MALPIFTSVPPEWRLIMRRNFTHWEKLADYLKLDLNQRQTICANPRFPLNIPLRLAEKIEKGTLNDPILRQFLPTNLENTLVPDFIKDPVGDCISRKSSKLLHKYHGRALLVCTSACAMHCRYCFRQNFDYETEDPTFTKELELLAEDSSIKEVILSGGDPLSLSDRTLKQLLDNICTIPHVRRIRFHTRFPIGIPERINEAFLDLLRGISCQVWFVIHTNHSRELDEEILDSLKSIQQLGIPVLNQSVLLRGVNDHIDILTQLCEKLIDNGIIPYYLHQLDRVQGAAHFEVTEAEGLLLTAELEKRLPGYGIPKYVREESGEASKIVLGNK